MQILILKATIKVHNPENTVTEQESGKLVTDVSENNSLIIHASRAIQVVPDWVKNDPTFKAHVKAKTILIIQTLDIDDDDNAETKLIKAEGQANAAGVNVTGVKTGWGATPADIPGFTSGLPRQ